MNFKEYLSEGKDHNLTMWIDNFDTMKPAEQEAKLLKFMKNRIVKYVGQTITKGSPLPEIKNGDKMIVSDVSVEKNDRLGGTIVTFTGGVLNNKRMSGLLQTFEWESHFK